MLKAIQCSQMVQSEQSNSSNVFTKWNSIQNTENTVGLWCFFPFFPFSPPTPTSVLVCLFVRLLLLLFIQNNENAACLRGVCVFLSLPSPLHPPRYRLLSLFSCCCWIVLACLFVDFCYVVETLDRAEGNQEISLAPGLSPVLLASIQNVPLAWHNRNCPG